MCQPRQPRSMRHANSSNGRSVATVCVWIAGTCPQCEKHRGRTVDGRRWPRSRLSRDRRTQPCAGIQVGMADAGRDTGTVAEIKHWCGGVGGLAVVACACHTPVRGVSGTCGGGCFRGRWAPRPDMHAVGDVAVCRDDKRVRSRGPGAGCEAVAPAAVSANRRRTEARMTGRHGAPRPS